MRLTLALILCVCVSGCGGGNSSSTTLNGSWQFTATSSVFVLTFTGTGTLKQNGTSLTGQITLDGSPCAKAAALMGNVAGSSFTFQLQEGDQAVSFSGNIGPNFSAASGTYIAPSGGCLNGDVGTWTAVRSSSS